jgi:hypothetical protein
MPFDLEPDGVVKVLKEFAVARGESDYEIAIAAPMSLEMLLCSDVSPIIP